MKPRNFYAKAVTKLVPKVIPNKRKALQEKHKSDLTEDQ